MTMIFSVTALPHPGTDYCSRKYLAQREEPVMTIERPGS